MKKVVWEWGCSCGSKVDQKIPEIIDFFSSSSSMAIPVEKQRFGNMG